MAIRNLLAFTLVATAAAAGIRGGTCKQKNSFKQVINLITPGIEMCCEDANPNADSSIHTKLCRCGGDGKWIRVKTTAGQLQSCVTAPPSEVPTAPPTVPATQPPTEAPTGNDSQMNMDLGNAISKAKQLCAIFEAIDCWQGGDDNTNEDTNEDDSANCDWMCQVKKGLFGGKSTQAAGSHVSGVQLTAGRGTDAQAKFVADPKDVLNTVRGICRVVDNGVSELPKLIPDGLLDKVGNGLLNKLLNGGSLDFSDIFMDQAGASSGAASNAGKILVTPMN